MSKYNFLSIFLLLHDIINKRILTRNTSTDGMKFFAFSRFVLHHTPPYSSDSEGRLLLAGGYVGRAVTRRRLQVPAYRKYR